MEKQETGGNRCSPNKEPKFEIGQVVMMKNFKKKLPFLIVGRTLHDNEWFYRWNNNNCAAEHMIRELTAEESGTTK